MYALGFPHWYLVIIYFIGFFIIFNTFKTVELTSDELLINYPFKMIKKRININQLKFSLSFESDATDYDFYPIRKLTILKNNIKVSVFTDFEFRNLKTLEGILLEKRRLSDKIKKSYLEKIQQEEKRQAKGILLEFPIVLLILIFFGWVSIYLKFQLWIQLLLISYLLLIFIFLLGRAFCSLKKVFNK